MYKDILTKEFLEKELIQNSKTIRGLAVEIGTTHATVIKYARKTGIYDKLLEKRKHSFNKKTKDLTGHKCGKLTVLKRVENDSHGKVRWLCKCSCGREKIINASSIIKKLSKSCGYCSRSNFTGYRDVSGSWVNRTKNAADKRGLEFQIDAKYIQDLYDKQNGLCAISGVPIKLIRDVNKHNNLQTASLDRIDNSIGYTEENVQLIHIRLHRLKSMADNNELITWAYLIVENNPNNPNIDVLNFRWNEGQR